MWFLGLPTKWKNNMDDFNLWNTALTTGIGALGYFIKSSMDRTKELERDVADLKIKLVENHPNKSDFKDFKLEISTMLHQLIDPVNTKLDNIENYLRNLPKRHTD